MDWESKKTHILLTTESAGRDVEQNERECVREKERKEREREDENHVKRA